MPRATVQQLGGQNRAAFLDMLASSEIGAALLAVSDDGYNVLVGSTPARPILFRSYAAHPDVYNKALNSTAAGRYQLLYRWFAPYKAMLNLPDFSPVSQDLIALQQIRERSALPLIDAGLFPQAVQACSNIWASLPGNNYGQHTNEMAALQAAYVAAGGTLHP
jgi:muramidase (phage lysozyme)